MKILTCCLVLIFITVNLFATESEAVSTVGTLSSTATDVKDNNNLPAEYKLEQNHPNPFNPTTTISYALPEGGNVIIKIYDINGNEIKTLINKAQNAGYYNVTFDASNLSSGLYFYSIISGNFIATKKMMLLK